MLELNMVKIILTGEYVDYNPFFCEDGTEKLSNDSEKKYSFLRRIFFLVVATCFLYINDTG